MVANLIPQFTFPIRLALRSQQVAFLFSSYGLTGALASLGIEVGKRGLGRVGGSKHQPVPFDAVFGKNLANTFVKLGPTFIKLGQIMASRPDLVGEPVANELQILFDRVPPIAFSQIQRILRQEFGKQKIKALIQSIEPQPLASASLSQTHRAVLKDGTPIILKIQKVGVSETVRLDLALLEGMMWPLHLLYPKYHLLQMFVDFKEATLREIDYREEAKNIDQFRKNYERLFAPSDVKFPRYFADLTSERVIALEPMQGKKIQELRRGSTIARHAAKVSLGAVLEQIFDHGFFHADPHAGNLFFLEDEGRVGFIDLGLVGQLDPKDKQKFLKVLLAILKRDRKELAKSLFGMGIPHPKKTNFADFERSIDELITEVSRQGVDAIRMDQLVNQLLAVCRTHRLEIPNRYLMMIRSCLLIEGVAKSLDPNLSVFKIATPIVAKSLMKTYNPLLRIRKWF